MPEASHNGATVYPAGERSRLKRQHHRGTYERAAVHAIL